MLRKADYRGSIRTLTDEQLRRLLNSANYRGLTAVAASIRREQCRRANAAADYARAHNVVVNPCHIKAMERDGGDTTGVMVVPQIDYAPPPRYDFDGYAGCRS